MIIGFFILPFKTLWMQSRKEFQDKVENDPEKSKLGNFFHKRRATFSILVYVLISGLILFSVISDAITDQDKVLSVITQAITAEVVFLLIVCSWQYLFNIIPTILDKSIDAKNGFILTLSAIVMIIYLTFMIFEVTRFAEMMIFVLVIGFIALLGVNLNLIVGEINIFQNLRQKKSKAVTRIVFIIFFGFHMYVILYASVVAYSIYNWDNNSYIFSNEVYDTVFFEDTYNEDGERITTLYDNVGTEIDTVYDISAVEIDEWYDSDEEPIYYIDVYDQLGSGYTQFYDDEGIHISNLTTKDGTPLSQWFYHEGTLRGYALIPIEKTYGDFLYYAVITISSVGYGDIYPSIEHNVAQAWGGFLSIYGLTFYALSIGFVSNIAMEGITRNREED
ncbi:potassium channel family protein, partial [Candidatus Izimaplasma bacterium]|nr:potassium channel family protein [Candidatus Izimaplasma bacterium]